MPRKSEDAAQEKESKEHLKLHHETITTGCFTTRGPDQVQSLVAEVANGVWAWTKEGRQ